MLQAHLRGGAVVPDHGAARRDGKQREHIGRGEAELAVPWVHPDSEQTGGHAVVVAVVRLGATDCGYRANCKHNQDSGPGDRPREQQGEFMEGETRVNGWSWKFYLVA